MDTKQADQFGDDYSSCSQPVEIWEFRAIGKCFMSARRPLHGTLPAAPARRWLHARRRMYCLLRQMELILLEELKQL
jgi:hypothetical protein